MIGITYKEFKALNPCHHAFRLNRKLLGGAWGDRKVSAREAKKAGVSLYHVLWVANSLADNDVETQNRMRLFYADCLTRVLKLNERQFGSDLPRRAIVMARRMARGPVPIGEVDRLCREMITARDRSSFNALYYMLRASLNLLSSGFFASSIFDVDDSHIEIFLADETAWRYERLVARLSRRPPEDWPLPRKPRRKK